MLINKQTKKHLYDSKYSEYNNLHTIIWFYAFLLLIIIWFQEIIFILNNWYQS